jgi:hypothetical protein
LFEQRYGYVRHQSYRDKEAALEQLWEVFLIPPVSYLPAGASANPAGFLFL